MSVHLKIKALTIKVKKLVLLSQHKLHMKETTSLYSVNSVLSALNSYFFMNFIVT